MEPQIEQPKEQKVAEEYLSSLADLNLNSKPLINMLTILAEENMEYAAIIVKVVEQHISKVNSDVKLPVLYLLDSIVKNVGGEYIQLFSNCIVNIFCGVFEKVNEKVREKMYILRQTWNDVFTPQKLYTLDVKVNCMDPNWPITAKVVPKVPAIHVNPNFLQNDVDPSDMKAKLQAKQRHLLELQKCKLELELAATKQRLEEQEKQLHFHNEHNPRQPNLPIGSTMQVGNSTAKPQNNLIHGQRNMFGPQIKKQDPGNNFSNYHNMQANHRPPVSTGNPIIMNSVNKRDPRLARQQMGNHKQMEVKKMSGNQSIHVDGLDNSINPLNTYDERENLLKLDDFRRSNLNNKLKSRSNGGGGSNVINKQRSSSSSSSSLLSNRKEYSKSAHVTDNKMSRSNDRSSSGIRNGSSKSSSSSPSKYDKDRNSRRRDKVDSLKRSQSNKESLNKIRDEKSSFSSSASSTTKNSHFGITSIKGGSMSPKSSSKQQNRRNKDTTKSPSPTKQDCKIICLETSDLPADKRIKLSSVTTESSKLNKKSNQPNTTSTITTTTTTTEKLDQNNEAESCKDIDLRAFESTISSVNKEPIKADESTTATSIGKIVTNQTLIERADEIRSNKKRPSIDNKQEDQPSNKKQKQEKIDTLFGSEDVDLRTEIPSLVVGALIAPPPPNISNENESWDKVKGTTKPVIRKISPAKSSLDDVRAKLAKAARSNNLYLGKVRKNLVTKIQMVDQEESQDGTDDNIRTIISQAQELLDTDNINADQYHTLVKTVIQINETNKLKEAQRRESLLDTNNTTQSVESSSDDFKPKEQRKRIPRIPKNDKSNTENSELKGLESQIPPPSSAGQTSSYSDMPPGREEKETKRKRQKETKWSTATPWEQQQQQQQQKNALILQKSWLQSSSRSAPQTNQSYPQNNNNLKNSSQNSGPPVRAGNNNIPNPWQNPPAIIFANPHQQMQAASSHVNPSAAITSSVTHHFSNSVDNPQADLVRTIPIDGVAKEIRVYDDVAIVFMDWDQPREIGFQNGQRRLIIDDQEPMTLNFNDEFKSITINGSVHRIKFGFPSRELYIGNNWYECYFGGPPLSIPLDGQMHVIKIEGPPPQVNIGMLRQDLVVGKINLIVDAHIIIPVFLDAKSQTFELNQNKHIIQFADQLTTVLIDNEPIVVEFGGLPKSVNLGDKKYFVRFGTLPHGVVPGRTNIKNMLYHRTKKIEEQIDYTPSIAVPAVSVASGVIDDIDMKDLNTNVQTNNMNIRNSPTDISLKTETMFPTVPITSDISNQTTSASALPALGNVNIDELFQKLLASGILNNQPKVENKTEEENKNITSPIKKEPDVTLIDLSKPETIKTRQFGIVSKLFCGMQCSSCGLRFPPEQTMKYSQHLDWHFRQNRRDRDSTRKAHSRKWYYDLADWIQYEEIEDIEDREKNWFESQQNDVDHLDENSNQRINSPPPSCSAGPDDVDRGCYVCHEKFEQFYNEDLEEWHLKSAVRVEEHLYHPICYQDFRASLNPKKEDTPPPSDENNDNYDDDSVIIVKQEKSEQDNECLDDDDVIEVPMEEPSITEILDDDEVSAVDILIPLAELPVDDVNHKNADDTSKNDATEQQNKDMSMEDDLMIQEPHIPFTDLDTYVERDPEDLNSENSMSQTQFTNIKIKEEPKDDDEEEEEEDAFEDVGTFAAVEVVQDSLDKTVDTTIPDPDDSNSIHIIENENDDSITVASVPDAEQSLASMDGNINIIDLPSSSTIGVNKIRINITKNVISNNNNSNNNNNLNNNIDDRNKSDNNVSTIPVITTTTNSNSSIIKLFNSNNSSNQDKSDSNIINNSKNDKTATIITKTTNNINSLTEIKNIDDLSMKSSNISTNNKPTIEFKYKPELENVVFNELPKIESGFETSGLCSIM